MAKAKKFSAMTIEMFAVYNIAHFFGNTSRCIAATYHTFGEAKAYVANKKLSGVYDDKDFMIEKVKVRMAAWDGEWHDCKETI